MRMGFRRGDLLTLKIIREDESVWKKECHNDFAHITLKRETYEPGDKIVVETKQVGQYLMVQLDSTLSESLIYIRGNEWKFEIPFSEKLRAAYHPNAFLGDRHYIYVRKATNQEIYSRRNLALNSHDQKELNGAYPHAFANVETRGESVFFAKNAIDGIYANKDHGKYPFQSWGINQQEDAEFLIDFGRKVIIDEVAITLRADFPHDSFWISGKLKTDDNLHQLQFHKTADKQVFLLPKQVTQKIKLYDLIKNEDESPFPALSQIEIWGYNV